jgi:hypothetical protein
MLGSLEATVKKCRLTNEGISLDNFRYQSDALHKIWFDAGGDHDVLVREDAFNGNAVLVRQERGKWIQAFLEGKYAGTELSRKQLIEQRNSDRASTETPEEANKRRRATLNRIEERNKVNGRNKTKPLPSTPPAKAATHINRPHFDAEASAAAPVGYNPNRPDKMDPYDLRGPFAEPSLVQRALGGAAMGSAAPSVSSEGRDPEAGAPMVSTLEEALPAVDVRRGPVVRRPPVTSRPAPPTVAKRTVSRAAIGRGVVL